MTEKIKPSDLKENNYISGYFKPKGKKQKRQIHKLARRMKDLDIRRKGIYNRIGVHWEWS